MIWGFKYDADIFMRFTTNAVHNNSSVRREERAKHPTSLSFLLFIHVSSRLNRSYHTYYMHVCKGKQMLEIINEPVWTLIITSTMFTPTYSHLQFLELRESCREIWVFPSGHRDTGHLQHKPNILHVHKNNQPDALLLDLVWI